MSKENVAKKIKNLEKEILNYLSDQGLRPESIYSYGAVEIDPKYLTIHLMFSTNKATAEAEKKEGIIDGCFRILKDKGYPKGKEDGVYIGFASIQDIKEKANGNWYHYFK